MRGVKTKRWGGGGGEWETDSNIKKKKKILRKRDKEIGKGQKEILDHLEK